MTGTMQQLRSTVTRDGRLILEIVETDIPTPRDRELLVRIDATPINPTDQSLLLGRADPVTVVQSGTADRPEITANIPEDELASMKARLDRPLPVGSEGAGVVVGAGSDDEAQALVGRTVAVLGNGLFAQYCCIPADHCLVLPEGIKPEQAASCFVNPLTALGMVETMREKGQHALVHTAAASNLGQMLTRICQKDDIALVNIVRKSEQVTLLRSLGARHVCNSSEPGFLEDLTDALAQTGATLGFDATGGGPLAGQILTCMEAAAERGGSELGRYGSMVHKQVYIYGALDRGPTVFHRTFGMAWGIGGWGLTAFLGRIGPQRVRALGQRIADEIETTFVSHYARKVSLAETLQPDVLAACSRKATGLKYLITPNE